jgi:flavin reductase (DIM6/NTAB) family NADH-FMN oxidoreductase RutF
MHQRIDLATLDTALAQHFLQCAIAPRPIALASTIDANGNINLSPFSFFNLFSTNPPILIFAPNRRLRDGSNKHTFYNVNEISEVVINIVDYEIAEQMSLSSCEYPEGINEFFKAGFTQVPSEKVKPPRVGEAKVSFECKVNQIIELGDQGGAGNLIICEVILMHVCDSIMGANGKIDPLKTDWIARSGESWYVRANKASMFTMPKPSVKLGVGVDSIPSKIIDLKYFSGNELGRLGNADLLPNPHEIESFKELYKDKDFLQLAKKLLAENAVFDAWKAVLSY